MEDIVDKILICVIDINSYLQSIYVCENKQNLRLVDRATIETLENQLLFNTQKHDVNKIHLFGLENYLQELTQRINKNLFNKNIEIEVN